MDVRQLDADQPAAILQAECLGDLPGYAHAVMITVWVVLDRDLSCKVHQFETPLLRIDIIKMLVLW